MNKKTNNTRDRTTNNIQAIDFSIYLNSGMHNAKSCDILCAECGINSVNRLRKEIKVARNNGQVILSSVRGGYYLPGNEQEIEDFIFTIQSRAETMQRSIRSAQEKLNQLSQESEQHYEN